VLTRHLLPLVLRPARYLGGERGAARGWQADNANVLLAFPDVYEVGMSHTGLRILYSELNRQPNAFADLVFAPWPDMEQQMRLAGLPLFSLNERRSAAQFDIIGFSLGYELAYTNLLTMLDLAGVPVRAAARTDGVPVIVAGGACTMNPAVIAPFVDVAFVGDGEPAMREIPPLVTAWKADGGTRDELVACLADLDGAGRPASGDQVNANHVNGGQVASDVAGADRVDVDETAGSITARIIADLNDYRQPEPLVPVIEPIHDRLTLEVMRGCARGCRFCQAGMISRPVRERHVASLTTQAAADIKTTGFNEVSLLSLSTSDYSGLDGVVAGIQHGLDGTRTNLAVPSLRIDAVPAPLYERINREKPASFTFAPEAGTQRLRDVINKQITEDDIVSTAERVFASGVKRVKLYFMIGLPTETNADLDGLVALVGRVVGLAPRGGGQITVSISPFAPKPHTPFQWAGQVPRSEIERRNKYLASRLQRLGVKVSLRDPDVSFLEAVLGLGDGAVSAVVETAWRYGARFDGWTEHFAPELWWRAFNATDVDAEAYIAPRDTDTPLPWDGIRAPVDRDFLVSDWQRALTGETLADCRLAAECYDCSACSHGLDHVEAIAAPTTARAGALEPTAAPVAFDPRNADPNDAGVEQKKWTIWRQQSAAKCWYRLEYGKTGDLRWLGHLDFQRQMQLALRRSRLPVAYSKGFNPHPLLKFGPPLAVGIAGDRESLDLALEYTQPRLVETLNAAFPPGLVALGSRLLGATTPRSIDQHLERFDYRISLPAISRGGPTEDTVCARIADFLAAESWPFTRHRPKGDVELDVRKLVDAGNLSVIDDSNDDADGEIRISVSLRRGEAGETLPVHDFLAALFGPALAEPRLCLIRRTGCYGRDKTGRWLTPLEEVGESSLRLWLRTRLNA